MEADGTLTKAAMETWMRNIHDDTAVAKRDLLATDAHLTIMSEESDAPETCDGKADVMENLRHIGQGQAREFLSVDGGAFMIEVKNDGRMGTYVFEVNGEGKIQDIKVWMGSLRGVDVTDPGLTDIDGNQTLLQRSRKVQALVVGAFVQIAVDFGAIVLMQAVSRLSLLALFSSSKAPGSTETGCQQSSTRPTLQQLRRFNASAEKLKALDLDAVVAVLEKDGYSAAKAADLAEEYRKYLTLVSTGLSPVPSKKVDDAWHAHILNTEKYQADTQALFGHVLHHEPANLLLDLQGMKEQKSSMDDMFSQTKAHICDYYGRVDEDAWSKDKKDALGFCACGCQCGCGCSCGCACTCACACACGCR